MKKRALLIEDRVIRQRNYASLLGEVLSHEQLHNVCGGEEFTNIQEALNHGDLGGLGEYHTIIIHRSSILSTARQRLIDYCKINTTNLVFFSGGISISNYSESLGFPLLHLNSANLYSSRLGLFLDDARKSDRPNVAILTFGLKWKLNLLLNFRVRLWSLKTDTTFHKGSVPVSLFLSKIGLTLSIQQQLSPAVFDWMNGNYLDPLTTIDNIADDLNKKITIAIRGNENFID